MSSAEDKYIESLEMVSDQLRQEGAHHQLKDLAIALTKGQYPDGEHDVSGALVLMFDAVAEILVNRPGRPKCCAFCDLKYLAGAMTALGGSYTQAKQRLEGE